jgi:hypothetical protein
MRTDGDGAQTVYTFDSSLNLYVNHDGADAYDTLEYSTGAPTWKWTDGTSRLTEEYDAPGGSRSSRTRKATH